RSPVEMGKRGDRSRRGRRDRFWLVLLGGLVLRDPLGRPRAGMALLVATAFVDLALLVATTIDLRRGGLAALPHALCAVYIGVSDLVQLHALAEERELVNHRGWEPRSPEADASRLPEACLRRCGPRQFGHAHRSGGVVTSLNWGRWGGRSFHSDLRVRARKSAPTPPSREP